MYAKVFTQIYDGTLCTKGPWEALVTFQQLLVLADQDGSVDMTAEAISRRTTIPLEIIKTGISALMKPDPDSRTPDEEGKRIVPLSDGRSWGWSIVNYKKYRELKREEDRREYHRNYWHKRSKLNTTQHAQQNQPIAEAYTEAKAVKALSGKPDEAVEVLNFLNVKTGRAYRATKSNLDLILARLKDGASVQDCKQVIARKVRDWLHDDKMRDYLRPATLFNRTKFDQYTGELVI